MQRFVKIFLSSSVTELKEERRDISALGDDISNLFHRDDIAIRFIKCDNIHEGNSGKHDQETIDQRIQSCDLSLFLFKTKAGEWTRHEYDVARALQKERHHKIYVYFLRVTEALKDESLVAFQKRLDDEGYYWTEFDNLSDVKSDFVLKILNYLGITVIVNSPEAEEVAKNGDSLFDQFEQQREQLHDAINSLLAQIRSFEPFESEETNCISAKIIEVIGLFKKADRWAAASAYDQEKYSVLLAEYADFLFLYGLYHDAEQVILRQIALNEELYGKEHECIAQSYNNLGLVFLKQGDYEKAVEYCKKALAIWKKTIGTEHTNAVLSYNSVGLAYFIQGNNSKALKYFQKALAIWKKTDGTELFDAAQTYIFIGQVYAKRGDYDKGIKYCQKALMLIEKDPVKEDLALVTYYDSIGQVYLMQGDGVKALEYCQKALAIWEKAFGSDHPISGQYYANIGSAYYELDDYGKAMEYYKKALAIIENALGTKHLDTANLYYSIGLVHHEQGDFDMALTNYQKALTVYEKLFGLDHPETAGLYTCLGLLYKDKKDYKTALEYYKKAKSKLEEERPFPKDVLEDINNDIMRHLNGLVQ